MAERPATTANNWTNWTAAVSLVPGTNIVSAYALDTCGNLSTVSNVSFNFVVTNQLQIHAIGLGNHLAQLQQCLAGDWPELQHHLHSRQRLCIHQLGDFNQLDRRHHHDQNQPAIHDGLKPDLAGDFCGRDQADPGHHRADCRQAHDQCPGNGRWHGQRQLESQCGLVSVDQQDFDRRDVVPGNRHHQQLYQLDNHRAPWPPAPTR